MLLAGDIGGTSARLALFEIAGGQPRPIVVERFASRDFAGLDEIVLAFIARHGQAVTAAAFGVAGPARDGRVVTPNLPWVIEAASLARTLGLEQVWLLNDLAATTHGIVALESADLAVLQAGTPEAGGARAVIAAGTGLGVAGALWDGRTYRIIPSEGGHADFAPRTEQEIALLRFLLGRFDHVSDERIVSGQGLVNIHAFLTANDQSEEPPATTAAIATGDPAAVIAQHGLAGTSSRCVLALDLFCAIYGAVAGNVALTMLATGGVYIGGGIAPKLLPHLQKGGFMAAFRAKGRHRALLEAVPVRVILNDGTALLGAGRYAAICARLIDAGG